MSDILSAINGPEKPNQIAVEPVDDVSADDIELQQIQELQRTELGTRQNIVKQAARWMDDSVRAVASGASFGFADEFAAFMNSMIGNREFTEELAAERARDKTMDPTLKMIGELTGGVMTGVATGSVIAPAAKGAARVAAFAAQGAVEGAIAGFGHAEGDIVNRAAGAAQGAAVGTVAGAAAPKVADMFVAGARHMLGHPGVDRAQKLAIMKLTKAMERDEITPERAIAKLRQLGPEAVVADLPGANIQGLARATAGVPGPARQVADRELSTRAVTSLTRVEDAIKAAASDESALAARDTLIKNRAVAAKPFYEEAFQAGEIDSPAVTRLLEKSADVKQAIAQARRIPEYADLPDNHVIMLDKAYKNLGGKVSAATRAGDKELARDLNGVRVELRNAMPDSYRKALDTFSSESDLIEALDTGRQFIKMDAELLSEAVKGMSEAEKQQLVIGVSRAIREKLENAQDSVSTVRRIFGNEGIRERLKLALPKGQFRDFQKTMLQEAVFAKTATKVLGGSPTAPRQAEVADLLSGGKAVATLDTGGIIQAIARMLPKSVPSKELGKTMFTTDVAANRGVFDQVMEQQMRSRIAQPLAGGLTGAGANAGATFGR